MCALFSRVMYDVILIGVFASDVLIGIFANIVSAAPSALASTSQLCSNVRSVRFVHAYASPVVLVSLVAVVRGVVTFVHWDYSFASVNAIPSHIVPVVRYSAPKRWREMYCCDILCVGTGFQRDMIDPCSSAGFVAAVSPRATDSAEPLPAVSLA